MYSYLVLLARHRTVFLVAALAVVLAVVAAGSNAAGPAWTVTQLADARSGGMAVNNAGTVAGSIGEPSSYQAVTWSRDGVQTLLPTPEGTTRSFAAGINSSGQVVGDITLEGQQEAALWGPDGTIKRLGFIPDGGSFSSAHGVNDFGRIVGVANDGIGYRAFAWNGAGSIVALPVPEGVTFSTAEAINNAGQIVGNAGSGGLLWEGGQVTKLPPLIEGGFAQAWDINNSGQIVGTSAGRLVVWEDGEIVDLGPLVGVPYAINDEGQIAGFTVYSGALHAFIWHDGTFTPLDPLAGDDQSFAKDVSGTGRVAGWSRLNQNAERAVVWSGPQTPVQQVLELIGVVESYNLGKLGTSLTDKLTTAQRKLEANKTNQACDSLDAFINQVQAQSGKGLTIGRAAELAAGAEAIKTAIGC